MTNLTTQIRQRAAALSLAVVTTMVIMASLNTIAATERADSELAARAAAAEVAQASTLRTAL